VAQNPGDSTSTTVSTLAWLICWQGLVRTEHMPLEVSSTSDQENAVGGIKTTGRLTKMSRKTVEARHVTESEPSSNVQPKILTNVDVSFRVRIKHAVACVAHFTKVRSPNDKALSERDYYDAAQECVRLGLLRNGDEPQDATALGRRFVDSYGHEEFADVVHSLFENDDKLKFVWSAVSDLGTIFKKQDVTDLFVRISTSAGHPIKRSTAGQYAYRFLEWARAARLCGSESFGVFKVRSKFDDAPYIIPAALVKPRTGTDEAYTERDLEVPILRLNALISDMILGERLGDEDLQKVERILSDLKGHKIIDDFIIDLLDDTIKTAISSEDDEVRRLAGRFLNKLRKNYLKEKQARLTEYA